MIAKASICRLFLPLPIVIGFRDCQTTSLSIQNVLFVVLHKFTENIQYSYASASSSLVAGNRQQWRNSTELLESTK
jgi:hypothetical protein